jgi:hypothetical protein
LKIRWNDWESEASLEPFDIFDSAPSLVDAFLYNHFLPIPLLTHQLTRYQIDAPWHQGILRLAQNLLEACINVTLNDEPWPDSGEIIELPFFMHRHQKYHYIRVPACKNSHFPLR